MRWWSALGLAGVLVAAPALAQTPPGRPGPRPAETRPAQPAPAPRDAKPADARPAEAPAADARKEDKKDGQPVTVDADRMERYGKESLIIFVGNVVARQNNSAQFADRMEVYLDEKGDRILRTIATGSVRIITRDCQTGIAKRAEYYDLEQRMVLIGSARVWQEDNVVSGDVITIFLSQDRSVVQSGKQERVKAVFYSKDGKGKNDGKPAVPVGAPPAAGGARPPTPTSCVN
jgi:lipopolysaccharide export system protein LptA